MGKKIASTVLITALILLSLCVTNFESAKAQQQEPVVINTDGSATGTSNIQRNGSVYTLTDNISGGIQVQKSNIIIDGAGYTIEGSGDGRGIDLYTGRGQNSSPIFDVTVKNMGIINFGHGIDSANSYNNSFVGNYVADCTVGIWLLASSEDGFANNSIALNTIENNIEGIHLDFTGKNTVITENNLIDNGIDVYVFLSQQPLVDRNYWSDYQVKYPDAMEIGNAGVWDTPYEYSEGQVDSHPQTKPIDSSSYDNFPYADSDFWIAMNQVPTGVSGKAAVVNDKIYVIDGAVNYEYDPVADTWVSKQPMPTPRRDGIALAVFENKIYVIGGRITDGGVTTGINEVYDPTTDIWETKKPMPTARQELEANTVNGKIYLIGGAVPDPQLPANSNVYLPSNKTEVYDPKTDTWTTASSLPDILFNYASAVLDDKIYLIAGNNRDTTNLTQIYNPQTDAWSLGAQIPLGVQAAAACTLSDSIYVVGGFVGFVFPVDYVQVYHLHNDSWTLGPPLPTARYSIALAAVNGAIYAIGGSPGLYENVTTQNNQYIPLNDTAPQQEPFPTAPVAVLVAVIVIVAGVILLGYFQKRKHRGILS